MKQITIFILCLLIPFFVFATGEPVKPPSEAPEVAETIGRAQVYNLKDYEQIIGKKLKYNEAPVLKSKVSSGEILSLKERLPEEPLVVKPVEEIGQYGGTLRLTAHTPMNWSYEFLAAYSPDMKRIFPNVLKDFNASEDGKTFTLYLRKGMRWSDGVPFTADDLMFYYDDIALNKELSPVVPARFVIGGEPGVMRKIDDYTVEISFVAPYGVFIEALCRARPNPYAPKHWLKQFHPRYTPMDEINKVMKEEKFDTWVKLFGAKNGGSWTFHEILGRPTISAWVTQSETTDPVRIWTRNPYYWKVDTEGNQLPYVDSLKLTPIAGQEAVLLNTLAGKVDHQHHVYFGGGMVNYSIVKENMEKGNYRMIQLQWPPRNMGTVYINLNHKDPILKNLFQDKRFRIAMSVAINREEVNGLLLEGLGDPASATLISGPPYYGEQLFNKHIQYDPELANQLLDEMGLGKRDGEGYRLRSDGGRLRMVNLASTEADWIEYAELYKKYWKEIGIEVVTKSVSAQMAGPLKEAGDWELSTSTQSLGGRPINPLLRLTITPVQEWSDWIDTKGEKGEEPPEEYKRIAVLRDEAKQEPDEEKRVALTVEIFKILEENIWVIGCLTDSPKGLYYVVSNRLRNVPIPAFAEYIHDIAAQFFIKE